MGGFWRWSQHGSSSSCLPAGTSLMGSGSTAGAVVPLIASRVPRQAPACPGGGVRSARSPACQERCASLRSWADGGSGDGLTNIQTPKTCLLYTSDAADEEDSVDLGGRR